MSSPTPPPDQEDVAPGREWTKNIPKQDPKKNSPIAVVILVLVLLGFGYFVFEQNNYERPDQALARQKAETEAARAKTAADYQALMSDPRTQQILRANELLGKVSVEIDEYSMEGEYSYVSGRIKNGSDAMIRYWEVSLEFVDGKGSVLDSDIENGIDNISPGATKAFKAMVRSVKGAKSVTAKVVEVTER